MKIFTRKFDITVQDLAQSFDKHLIIKPHLNKEAEQINDGVYIACLIFYEINRSLRNQSLSWNK